MRLFATRSLTRQGQAVADFGPETGFEEIGVLMRGNNVTLLPSRLELSRWCDGRYRVSWGQQFWRWVI